MYSRAGANLFDIKADKAFYDEIKSGGIFYEKETFKRKANFDNANDRNV